MRGQGSKQRLNPVKAKHNVFLQPWRRPLLRANHRQLSLLGCPSIGSSLSRREPCSLLTHKKKNQQLNSKASKHKQQQQVSSSRSNHKASSPTLAPAPLKEHHRQLSLLSCPSIGSSLLRRPPFWSLLVIASKPHTNDYCFSLSACMARYNDT